MKAIRAKVSGSRKRYTQDGFDLDLTYITPQLIAMGYPACGMEKTYRNDIAEVAQFLNTRHPNAYKVFNLSERNYDYAKFEHRVSVCGFPDHHPPPLQVLLDIMNEMLQWIAESDRNVIVVHCLAGKGRTGVVCSCYLLLTGHYGDVFRVSSDRELREMANVAIKEFWTTRGQGVRFPSQALYIYYFVRVIRRLRKMPLQIPRLRPARRLLLKRIVLHGIPDYDAPPRGGCTPFLQVLPAPSQHEKAEILYNSSWQNPNFETYASDPQGSIVFEANCPIQGDVLVRCFHANAFSILGKNVVQMFHVTFNTNFINQKCDVYRLPKEEIDEAHNSQRFPSTFCLDFHVEACDRDSVDEVEEEDQVHDQSSPPPPAPMALRIAGRTSSSDRRRSSLTPSQQPTQPAPMMGWLYKQGGFIKNWKRRWFVARDGQLMYYNTVSDPTPLGVVDLHRATVDVCTSDETTAKNDALHYFKVVPPLKDQRVWFFGAESEQDMARWIRALATQTCHGLSGSPPTPSAMRRVTSPVGIAASGALGRSNTFHGSRTSFGSPYKPRSGDRSRSSASSMDLNATTAGMRGSAVPLSSSSLSSSVGGGSAFGGRTTLMDHDESDRASSSSSSPTTLMRMSYDEYHFLTSATLPSYTRSQPLADMTALISDHDRLTMLQETTEDFTLGTYIYTADELQEAARLQQYLAMTVAEVDSVSGLKVSLKARLEDAVARQDGDLAEQLLVQVVVTKFSRLVDAMECNPREFVEMIAGRAIVWTPQHQQQQQQVRPSR